MMSAVCAGALVLAAVAGCGPATPGECLDQAAVSASKNEWKQAMKLTARAVSLAPDSSDALVFNAIASLRCGELEKARVSASRAVALTPESFIAQYTLGRVCMDDPEHRGEAMRALLNALKLRRDDRDTLVLLCNLGIEVASPNTLSFLNMLKRDQEFAESAALYNQLALAYLRNSDTTNAQRAFVNAWRNGRDNLTINYNAGCFFDRYTKAQNVALRLYDQYLKLSEGNPAEAAPRAEVAARVAELSRKQ